MNNNNIIVATTKSWNLNNFKTLKKKSKGLHWHLIQSKKNFSIRKIRKINPKYIFIPHWSWIIPEEIWANFECVVFHMTDLPYGRGGTPLQNLIARGHKKTKISAIRVNSGIDTGDIYLKKGLDLSGNAENIYKRASNKIFMEMIPYILKNNPVPKKQKGNPVIFKRRNPQQSKIKNNFDLNKTHDHIRMLDAEGYPKAFLEIKKVKFDFFGAKIKGKGKDKKIIATVEIYER